MMKKINTRRDYGRRLARVLEYIALNMDGDLSTETLAGIACFSPYHFHRIYHGFQGETVAATIRRVRLFRAAGALISLQDPIKDIANAAGYGSTEAFTRAFAKLFGITPARYREKGSLYYPQPTTTEERMTMYKVEIKQFPAMRLAAIRHVGNYLEVGTAFERLSSWAVAGDQLRPDTTMLGIYYDDPKSTPEAELRSDAALTVDVSVEADETVTVIDRPAITGAVITHKGPYAELHNAYDWIYGEWLPQSGYEPADEAPHEIYLNTPRDAAPKDLLTEICIPIKA